MPLPVPDGSQEGPLAVPRARVPLSGMYPEYEAARSSATCSDLTRIFLESSRSPCNNVARAYSHLQ